MSEPKNIRNISLPLFPKGSGGEIDMEINRNSITDSFKPTKPTSDTTTTDTEQALFDLVTFATKIAIEDKKQLAYLHRLKQMAKNEVLYRTHILGELKQKEHDKKLSEKDKQLLATITKEGINPFGVDVNDERNPQIRTMIYNIANHDSRIKRKVALKKSGGKQHIVIIYNDVILKEYAQKGNEHAKQLLQAMNRLPDWTAIKTKH